jgi:group I intron endonuclease
LKDPINFSIKYIGKSDNPPKRYIEHIRKHKHTITKKNNWIKKLISIDKKPILEILDVIPFSEWSFWEKYWIGLFKSWGFNLYNLTNGGDGGNYGPESNRKISEKLKNRKFSDETIKLMSESAKKRKLTEEGRKKLSKSRTGGKNPMFGKKQSLFCVESKYKPVIQLTIDGEFVAEWKSLKEVSEYLLINRNTIRMVCNNQRRSAGGYKWKFK